MSALLLVCILGAGAAAAAPHDHHDHNGEVGVSAGAAYLVNDNEFAPALHLHGVLAAGKGWGFGLGYGRLFGEHPHNSVGAIAQYHLTPHWVIAVSPGIILDDHLEIGPALHLETVYSFPLGPIHVGPVFETAFEMHDGHLGSHLTLGIHAGFEF